MNLPTAINLCQVCGGPGTHDCWFLLPNARTNPSSAGYRRDGLEYCADRTLVRCAEHADWPKLDGYEWASTRPLPDPPADKPFCCLLGCRNAAEYEIIGGSGHFEDQTHACPLHIGHLLGTPSWIEKPNREWTVVAVGGSTSA